MNRLRMVLCAVLAMACFSLSGCVACLSLPLLAGFDVLAFGVVSASAISQSMHEVDASNTILASSEKTWLAANAAAKNLGIKVNSAEALEKKNGGIIKGETDRHETIWIVVNPVNDKTAEIGVRARLRRESCSFGGSNKDFGYANMILDKVEDRVSVSAAKSHKKMALERLKNLWPERRGVSGDAGGMKKREQGRRVLSPFKFARLSLANF